MGRRALCLLVAPSIGVGEGTGGWGGQREMDRGMKPRTRPRRAQTTLDKVPCFQVASLTHLITLTRSWKALSTLRGGSLALVSMYGIWKASEVTEIHKALFSKKCKILQSPRGTRQSPWHLQSQALGGFSLFVYLLLLYLEAVWILFLSNVYWSTVTSQC